MEKERVETRKDEIRFVTSEPEEMLNRWLPNRVCKKREESFMDTSTGEVVTIDREELLFERGTLITPDVLQEIRFYMAAGDIKEVEVSNQKRLAFENKDTRLCPWQAKAKIGNRKYKFLLYASGITNAIEILTDYIELNYASGFTLVMAKEMDSCVILADDQYVNIKDEEQGEDDEIKEKKFYKLEVKITYSDDIEESQDFIVRTFDTDQALMVISCYLKQSEQEFQRRCEENGWAEHEARDFKLCIEKVAPMSVADFIPKEFSMAYN